MPKYYKPHDKRVSKQQQQNTGTIVLPNNSVDLSHLSDSVLQRIDLKDHNFIINGGMDLWQRNTSFVNTLGYGNDRFRRNAAGSSQMTRSRITSVPTQAESGYSSRYALRCQITTGASPGASDHEVIAYYVEGNDFANLLGNNAVLSFWVRSSVAQRFYVAFRNSAVDRVYAAPFDINVANTWELKTIPVYFDPTGTWTIDESLGLRIEFALAAGSNFFVSAINQWVAGNDFAGSDIGTTYVTTTNATFDLTQVKLQLGEERSVFTRAGKTIEGELSLAQRYYEKSYNLEEFPGTAVTTDGSIVATTGAGFQLVSVYFRVRKRAAPTGGSYSTSTAIIDTVRDVTGSTNVSSTLSSASQSTIHFTTSAGAGSTVFFQYFADAEL